jgi:hypothetical protein
MNTIELWLQEARLRFAALGRGLVALLLLTVVSAGLWMGSLHLAAWDRWAIAQVLARTSPVAMSRDIVLVHIGKPQGAEGRSDNHHERREAVAAFLMLLAEQDTNHLPAAVVIDMTFRRDARDEAPAGAAPDNGREATREATPRRAGFERIDAALKALRERPGDRRLFATLDPFERDHDIEYFDSSEPWLRRDLRFAEASVRYGHTAFEVDSDCSLGGFWPVVNLQTHPAPPGAIASGPTDDVEALAPLVARRTLDRERYAPLYFVLGDRRGTDADILAFDPLQRHMHRLDATRRAGLGARAQVDWGGKTVIVGDAVSDRLRRPGMSCSLPGIELIGWLVTDLQAPRKTVELLNPKGASAGWLLAVPGAIVAHAIVSRRASRTRHAFFYPLRTLLYGLLGGIALVAALCAGYAFVEGSIPGFLLPAAAVLGAAAASTWYFHRIRTAVTDIFISYKRDAITEPRRLVRWIDLSLRGITLPGRRRANVFLDVKKLEVTQHWKTEARRRIGEAKIFVPILTREYVEQVSKSLAALPPNPSADDIERVDACTYEVFYAMRRLDSGLRLFPVLLEGVKIPVEHEMLRHLGEHVGMKVEGGRFDVRDFRERVRKLVNEFSPSDWVN